MRRCASSPVKMASLFAIAACMAMLWTLFVSAAPSKITRVPSACADADGNCAFGNINADDDTYEEVNLKTDPYGWLNVTDWNQDVSLGYIIVNATIYVNWTNSSTPKTGNVYVEYIDGGGGWQSCAGPVDGCHQAECQSSCTITSISLSSLNSLVVRFRGQDLDLLTPAYAKVDYIYMVVYYDDEPPQWRRQQTNDTDNKIPGSTTLNLSAEGYDYIGLGYAWLETNETAGTWINYTGVYSGNYSSPMYLGNAADAWTQSNFSWYNSSITEAWIGWKIWYNDTVNGINGTSAGAFLVDKNPPTLTIDSPSNATNWSHAYNGFAINGTCSDTGAGAHYVYTNDSHWSTMDTTPAASNLTNASALVDGTQYYVRVTCNDSVNNTAVKDAYFTYDGTKPSYRYRYSNDSDDTISAGVPIVLAAQGYDAVGLSYAWLETNETGGTWINYTGVYSGNHTSPMALGAVASWTWSNFTWENDSVTNGDVGWKIWYNDSAGNIAVTDLGVFKIQSTANGNLYVSLDYPTGHLNVVQNDTFWVNATVTCVGANCGTVYGVLMYNASAAEPDTNVSTSAGATPLWTSSDNAQSCGTLNQNGICMLNWSVNATGWFLKGYALDVNFSSAAVNNDTDNANITIINSYQTYYGNTTGNITLALSSGSQMMRFNVTSASGVVFITDADSTISWTELVELGKKTDGSNSSNDFAEVDSVLGITGKPDSLNASYSTDGSKAKLTVSMTAFNATLSYVPVALNVGNSSFKTGILWDSSDDEGNGEFDSTRKEDLVFVVKMSPAAACYGGNCDYEIKIPYALKSYKAGADLVSFYVDFL